MKVKKTHMTWCRAGHNWSKSGANTNSMSAAGDCYLSHSGRPSTTFCTTKPRRTCSLKAGKP